MQYQQELEKLQSEEETRYSFDLSADLKMTQMDEPNSEEQNRPSTCGREKESHISINQNTPDLFSLQMDEPNSEEQNKPSTRGREKEAEKHKAQNSNANRDQNKAVSIQRPKRGDQSHHNLSQSPPNQAQNHQNRGHNLRLDSALVFLTTALVGKDLQRVKKILEVLNGHFVTDWHPSVTHIITKNVSDVKGEYRTSRTLKFLKGVLQGKWIVTEEWVDACLKEKRHVPENLYEVLGDDCSINGGAKRARETLKKGGLPLFSSCRVFFLGPFSSPSKEELETLVEIGGGKVLKSISVPETLNIESSEKIILVSDVRGRAERKKLTERYGLRPVTKEWVLDSIASFTVRSLDGYDENDDEDEGEENEDEEEEETQDRREMHNLRNGKEKRHTKNYGYRNDGNRNKK